MGRGGLCGSSESSGFGEILRSGVIRFSGFSMFWADVGQVGLDIT